MGPGSQAVPGQRASSNAMLKALRERFPEWDIHQVFGGYEAVPKGTAVIRAAFLDSLDEKLTDARVSGGSLASEQPK